MSTLVNLLIGIVLSILGGELQQKTQEVSTTEIIVCTQKIEQTASYFNIATDAKFSEEEI